MTPLLLTTILQIVVGLAAPLLLARFTHRRWAVPYALLAPGVIVALVVQIAGVLLGALLGGGAALLAASSGSGGAPSFVFVGVLGLLSGFLIAGALAAALVWLAPGAATVPQMAMIGVGYGGAEVMLRAVLAALLLIANLRLIETPPARWNLPPEEVAARQADLDAYFARDPVEPLLEAGVALARLALGLALTLLVGRMFLTGEVGWFFGAALWGAVATAGQALFSRGGLFPSAVWWAFAGAVSLIILFWRGGK